MNVCFVISTRGWGGVKTWALDAAAELARRGHGVTLIGRPGPFVDKARALPGLDAQDWRFGFDYNPALVARFLRFFRENRVDRLIVNVAKELRTAGLAARLASIPVVHRIGLPGDMRPSLQNRLDKALVRPAYLAPCEFVKSGLVSEMRGIVRPEEVAVIHTGKRPSEAPTSTPDGPRRLLMTSQLNPDKGHAAVLAALASLAARGIDFRLTVAGTGRAEAELQALARAPELAGRVRFTGFTSNVAVLLDEADVFILNSASEGLSNALLEAMARGLAVVARDVGGTREIWPDALTDCLLPVQPSAHDGLTEALERLLTEPREVLDRRKAAGLAACRERFSLDAQVGRLETYLSGLGG